MKDGVAHKAYQRHEAEHGEQRTVDEGGGNMQCCGEHHEGGDMGYPALPAPPFVDQYAQAVESAPGDEVERGSVPQSAQEHGVHVVDVGAKCAAMARTEDMQSQHQRAYCNDGYGEACVVQAESGDGQYEEEQEVAEEPRCAVAAEGYVEVVAQPARERHVPAAPEVGGVLCLVGRVEVLWQVEAHQHCHADGYVGIAREVGVDLHGVEYQG